MRKIKLLRGNIFGKISPLLKVLLGVVMLMCITDAVFAGAMTMTTMSTNIGSTVKNASKILFDVALIAGIGFIFAAAFKLHQHKLNPTQVPMSQGLSLLLIGGGLTMFPTLITLPGSTWVGSAGNIKTVGTGISAIGK